jgi:hypothetical protein
MAEAEHQASPSRGPLAAGEYAFLICTVLFWAAFVVVLGKDTSWDFRNYHWYGPYALFNNRLGIDVAVAHQASWYNPYLDVPFYLLATHFPSWVALAALGAAQGANVVPLYLMARHSLRVPDIRLWSGALAILGQAGALTLTEFGTTYYDNVMSVLVFIGLAIIVMKRETLRQGPLGKAAGIALAAGLVSGSAMGLKLPQMPFCAGFAAALLVLGGSWRHVAVRMLAGGVGGFIGAALFSLPWMWHVWQLTGNPLFPYWNDYWHSPLALDAPYRDLRFVPAWRPLWQQIFFPVLFTIDWHVADDLGFQDVRVLIAYFAVIAATIVWALRRQNRDPLSQNSAALPLMAFGAVSYFVWLRMFAIYRYIVALEMIAPLLIVVAVGLLPGTRRARYLALGACCFAILVTARSDFLEHAPLDDPYIQVALPPIARPDRTMVVMAGDAPMGFIATQLPPAIPVLRIDGWMVQPRDASLLTRQMKARVAAQLDKGGDLYLLIAAIDMARAKKAVADYGLAIRLTECQQFDTNLGGTYQWCPLARVKEAPRP